jgi:hypothetical protein
MEVKDWIAAAGVIGTWLLFRGRNLGRKDPIVNISAGIARETG